MKKLLQIFIVLSISTLAWAQDSATLSKEVTLNGYIKDLQTLSFNPDFRELISGNLIHNRVNAKWKPSEKVAIAAEIRNRLFWGEEVKLNPNLRSRLRNENEKVNLQKVWINTPSLILHTNVERLYFDYRVEKLQVRIGRQRVNWGIATTWNPNDIFNVYDFLDFDYAERPGIDGGTLKHSLGNSSSAELAYAHTGKRNGSIVALKYALNKWGYDMQLITGWYKDRPTLGIGWAGNIKDAGFKGEVQYFPGYRDSTGLLNLSLEADYMLKNGWYISAGFLFNNRGLYKSISNWSEMDLDLSSTNLMPTKWNMIVTAAKELTPLLSANMNVVYSPGTNLFIVFPSVQYNIATNFDLSFVWQSFFSDLNNDFRSINHRCFLRAKWFF